MPLYGGSALTFSPMLLLAAADPAAAAIFAFRTEPLRPQTALFPLLCSLFSLLLMLLLLAAADPAAAAFLLFLFITVTALSALFSLLSSLSLLSSFFSRCCSFLRSHCALVTSNFASGHRLRFHLHPLDPLPHYPWPGRMREAMIIMMRIIIIRRAMGPSAC